MNQGPYPVQFVQHSPEMQPMHETAEQVVSELRLIMGVAPGDSTVARARELAALDPDHRPRFVERETTTVNGEEWPRLTHKNYYRVE